MKKIWILLTFSLSTTPIATSLFTVKINQNQQFNQKTQENINGDQITVTKEEVSGPPSSLTYNDDINIWIAAETLNAMQQNHDNINNLINKLQFTDNTGFISDDLNWRSQCQNQLTTWITNDNTAILAKLVAVTGTYGVIITTKVLSFIKTTQSSYYFHFIDYQPCN